MLVEQDSTFKLSFKGRLKVCNGQLSLYVRHLESTESVSRERVLRNICSAACLLTALVLFVFVAA